MRNIIALYVFAIIFLFSCNRSVSPNTNVDTFAPNPENLNGFQPDLRYKNSTTNPQFFYQSNGLPMLNFIYQNSKKNKTTYEINVGSFMLNWNKSKELLFVNTMSDACSGYYRVYVNISEEKLAEMAKIKMDFEKDGWPLVLDNHLGKRPDDVTSLKLTKEFFFSNSCK
jgi:hypothetical protein